MPTVPTLSSLDVKPLYALAGAGDLAVEQIRTRVAAFPTRVAELRKQRNETLQTLPARAQALPAELRKQAETLPAELRKQAENLQTLPAELRKQAEGFTDKAASVYDDFATRGEKVVAGLRRETPKTKSGAKPVAKKAASKSTAKKATTKPATKVASAPAASTAQVTPSVPTTPVSTPAPTVATPTPSVSTPAASQPTLNGDSHSS